jgi:hypothetical protein
MSHPELINEIQKSLDKMPDDVLEKILLIIKEKTGDYSDSNILEKLEIIISEHDILLKRLSE